MTELEIRASTAGDAAAVLALYHDAFPNEDLSPLVRELLGLNRDVLSLVGHLASTLVAHVLVAHVLAAHVMFTRCAIDMGQGADRPEAALLGPLAVAPDAQGKGAGSQIVRDGLRHLEREGIGHVFVLGDPAYYRRFGLTREERVAAPFPLPDAYATAWQSLDLGAAGPPAPGSLSVPPPWRRKELWAP